MDKHYYINKFQPIVKPDLERLEKSTLINLAIHQHRLFFNSLIIPNNNMDSIKKMEMIIELDNIFFTLYHFLMLDIEDENVIAEYLLNQDFVIEFLNKMNEYNLFNPIL
jgi:hypothetical protein